MENELMGRLAGHFFVACEDIEHIANVQMYPRLNVAAQMAAALVPHMLHHTPYDIARRAVELANALIEVCEDEPAEAK